jgi:hypothetical protein
MRIFKTIPATSNELTPGFFSQILACKVASLTKQRIGEDEGFSGSGLFRINLVYEASPRACPETLVAKLSPSDPSMRATFAAVNKREIEFYTKFSGGALLPIPKCYFGEFNSADGASVLVIEDLGKFRTVGFLETCTATEASNVVDALSRIHAAFWKAPSVTPLSGANILQEFDFQKAWNAYPEAVSKLLPHLEIPESFFKLCQFVADNDQAIFSYLMNSQPLTLLHRDVTVDNILFGEDIDAEPAVIFDWQLTGKGKGVYDLAYFLISSIEPDMRREIEGAMLTKYHDALIRQGIDDYSFDQCKKDFVGSVVGKIYLTVIATAFLDNSTPHKITYREADLTRLLVFCEDHDISQHSLAFMLD